MFGFGKLVLCVLLVVVAIVGALPMYPAEKRQFEQNLFNRELMHFGKRSPGAELYDIDGTNFNRAFMPFGKRDYSPLEQIVADKKNFNREFMHFGKRSAGGMDEPFQRDFMNFGR
ncbi:hypothetical protein M3Y97_01106900 [Aphelenchoides bicaudatus]|nr:hypothetical protein M3Y97_01106900 [Aphelenchoides bicaudatus]